MLFPLESPPTLLSTNEEMVGVGLGRFGRSLQLEKKKERKERSVYRLLTRYLCDFTNSGRVLL